MLNHKRINRIVVVLLIGFIFCEIRFDISYWILFVVLFGWLGVTIVGSFHIGWNYFLKAYHKSDDIINNNIAITFDDGPHPEITPKVLKLLKEFNMKATFFCIGKNMEKYPEIVKQLLVEGHVVGNHSYAHDTNNGFLSTNRVMEDLSRCQKIFKDITGNEMLFFRPPFGVTNPNIARAILKLRLKTIGWSVRSYDTVAKNANRVFIRISKKMKRGDVILLHDTSEKSVVILEKLLNYLEKEKMNSVTIDQLLNCKAYDA